MKGDIGSDNEKYMDIVLKGGADAVAYLINTVGMQVTKKIMVRVIAKVVGRQVGLNITRLFFAAIPIINVILSAWIIIDITGPAYRKTVPTVIEVALLRMQVEMG